MEFFRFCLEIIRREARRFNVGIKNSTVCELTAATANDINYDDAHNRCAFLYRCGTINLSFAKDCFSNFLSDYNVMKYLLTKWGCNRYLTFCSVSKGPALDYIALLLSNEQCKILTSLIGNIRIITRHGAWRNTANIMLEIVNEGFFKLLPPLIGAIEVTQGDPFDNFTEKVRLPISDSDVVMMIKTLNLQSDGYDQQKVSKSIQEFLDALKPGAVLFCIDTKPSIKEITQILTAFPGKFLLNPTPVNTIINLEYTDLYKAQFECLPIISARGCFFVWEKSSFSTSSMQCELNVNSELFKNKFDVADKNDNKVKTDKSRLELSCATSLDKLKNSNQELLEYFHNYSTPKLSDKTSEANCSLRKELADGVNSCCEKPGGSLPSDSLVNGSISPFDQFKAKHLTSLNSVKYELDSVSSYSSLRKSICPLPADSVSSESILSPHQFEAGSCASLNSLKYDLDSVSNTNNIEQSRSPLSSDLSANGSIDLNAECLQSLIPLKSQLDLVSNECLQATQELSKETEVAKITELKNKITDLTVELRKLLENNTVKDGATNSCFRCSEGIDDFDTKATSCSTSIPISQNFKTCCCCQKCACHHFHLSSNLASMCSKTSNFCRSSSSARSSILAENTKSSAKIVIPLNSLPANVVSEIISLITKPKLE